MKNYIFIALSIITIGIFISSAFLWLFLDRIPLSNNILIEKNNSNNESVNSELERTKDKSPADTNHVPEKTISENEVLEQELPTFVENKAPFVSQAPFGIWDELHEEACEEASIIIANKFLNNATEISKETADKEIQALVDWQIKKYGKHKDLNVKEIQDMAFGFYGDKLETFDEINEKSFRKILAEKNIIIIPVAGREIGNPNFTPPGPLYHALVVIGYDESTQEFITNDPGTRKGSGFRYSYKTLLNSIHDFPGKKENILNGNPQALIVRKK